MAAPKKCRSLVKRKIAIGSKLRYENSQGFNGFNVKVNNIVDCSSCKAILRSHQHCHDCLVKEIKSKNPFAPRKAQK